MEISILVLQYKALISQIFIFMNYNKSDLTTGLTLGVNSYTPPDLALPKLMIYNKCK
jgi:hypothetical protein